MSATIFSQRELICKHHKGIAVNYRIVLCNHRGMTSRRLTIVALSLLACAPLARAQTFPDKHTTASGAVVTVYAIAWPNPTSPVSADVEVCASATAQNAFAFPSFFQVHFVDGGVIGSVGSIKKPSLERTPLKPKQCARGWLDFAVVNGQKPVAIHYHEAGADKKPIEWAVPTRP